MNRQVLRSSKFKFWKMFSAMCRSPGLFMIFSIAAFTLILPVFFGNCQCWPFFRENGNCQCWPFFRENGNCQCWPFFRENGNCQCWPFFRKKFSFEIDATTQEGKGRVSDSVSVTETSILGAENISFHMLRSTFLVMSTAGLAL